MVDPSLLRLAAERGVTICFADLDGAAGLWVPEERTVLVNRALSEREVAEVIEHELGHVAIDDQHADLDAGVVRRPPGPSRLWAAALTAAACFAVVGGMTAGMASREQPTLRPEPVVAPSRPPLTGPAGPAPRTTVTPSVAPNGQTVPVTVTVPAPSRPTPSASGSGSPSATAARTAGAATGSRTVPPVQPTATTGKPPQASPSPSPTPSPDAPAPTDTGTPDPTATVAGPIQDGTAD